MSAIAAALFLRRRSFMLATAALLRPIDRAVPGRSVCLGMAFRRERRGPAADHGGMPGSNAFHRNRRCIDLLRFKKPERVRICLIGGIRAAWMTAGILEPRTGRGLSPGDQGLGPRGAVWVLASSCRTAFQAGPLPNLKRLYQLIPVQPGRQGRKGKRDICLGKRIRAQFGKFDLRKSGRVVEKQDA